jgi:tRNA threonylcarbamoyladenosine biosynthesis protein TsaB
MTPFTGTILAIETSTPCGSVAIWSGGDAAHGGGVIFSETCPAGRQMSAQIFPVLERALQAAANATPPLPPVIRIVVGLGPGSYAGVRIALAAATGLSLALGRENGGVECVGLPSIVAMEEVENPMGACGEYIALGDARRETFYYAHVRHGLCVEGPLLLPRGELLQKLAADGLPLPLYAAEPLELAGGGLPSVALRIPSAAALARLAAENRSIVAGGKRLPPEPIYLREPHITQARKR